MKTNYLPSKKSIFSKLLFTTKSNILFVTFLFLPEIAIHAQTAGPANTALGANINGTGTIAWTSFGNITAADGISATAAFTGAANSNYLQGTNYGFTLPAGVVVDGIEVTINRKTSAVNAGRITKDNVVSLVKAGVIVGNNKATTTAWTTSLTTATYGSPTDKWGTTWTAADINATNFGAVISANANNSLTAYVDYIQIKIYYTPAPTISGFSVSSACSGTTPSVVITGTNFTNTSNVTFNGISAPFTVNNATQITATLPSNATSGSISVTTPSGTCASATSFTVYPLPIVASITGSTTLCIGNTTTLSDVTNGGNWSSASTAIATINASGVVTGNSAGTSIITYTYTNGNGCTSAVTTTISVSALPIVTSGSSVCVGNSTQLLPSVGGTWISNDTTTATIDNSGLAIGLVTGNVTFTYIDSSTGCSATSSTVSIVTTPTILSNPAVSQSVCLGGSVSFSVVASGGALSYQWYNGATALTNGGTILGATSATLTINSVANSDAGTQYYCVVSNNCSGSVTSDNATLLINAISVGGNVTSSIPNVTPAVNSITECHFATGTLYLSGQVGNVIRWEYTTTGGATWVPVVSTATTYTYTNITASTFFRAVLQNSSCSVAYSSSTLVNVIPNVKPTPVTATPSIICVGDSSDLYSESGFATSSLLQNGGTFSNANPANWLVDGCGNCLNSGGSNTNPAPFHLSATNGGTYSGVNYTSSGKFAIANGNFNSIMETPTFNTYGLTNASLSFNHAFNLQAGASATVELSLDGGISYSIVLAQYIGASTRTPYTAFPNTIINLSSYIGQANLRVRFTYAGNVNSSWAIDNILIPEAPSNLTTEWVDSSTGLIISNTATATVTPSVTTTYAITSHLNGCTSYGPDGTTYITVTVNQRPTANIGPSQTVCNGGTATFSVALTGTAPWSLTYSNGSTTTTANNITTNPYVFTVNGMTTNKTYTITALSDSKCIAKTQDLTGAAVVTVLNGTAGLWTGLVSTDWFDCKNWAGGLPSATVNAQIPAGATRMPLIDPTNSTYAALYSNIARAQDVIIANSASLTMAANSNLYVSRDWKNSGTFTPGSGTVTFNGSTSNQIQTINSGIKSNETFYNFTLNTSNGAKGISVIDGFALTVSNTLSLQNGDIRLVGEAQLLQSGNVANPSTGSGRILKDQQGSQSSYHYNYWSSPVTTNGSTYTVSGVMRDGTDAAVNSFSPSTINFGSGYYFADGALTSPIKISTSWIYKYTSVSTTYAGWQYVGDTGTINAGEGFTMKGNSGSSSNTTLQNYVFVGKPNNGPINLNISLNQSYLVGNPYPSALDADEFIKDNIKDGAGRATSNIFNGALYFWDHFGGTTHILGQYVGGYATYSLMGGVVAMSNDPLTANNGNNGTKVPSKYIAVGQGFFIGTGATTDLSTNNPNLSTPVTGGAISFKNSQRVFKTETSGNSTFFKNNATATEAIDERQKIRLSFESPSGTFRQLLVGVDENTTSGFDIGYDAPMIDANTEDLYWPIDGNKFTIQALSNFDENQIVPIGIVTATEGICTIKIAGLENIQDATSLFLHDNVTGTDYDLRSGDFTITLPIGVYNDRFSLRFSGNALGTHNSGSAIRPLLYFTNSNQTLNIQNNSINTLVKSVSLFNLLGQAVGEYRVADSAQTDIKIPLLSMVSGTYIVKVKTDSGNFGEKIIIR